MFSERCPDTSQNSATWFINLNENQTTLNSNFNLHFYSYRISQTTFCEFNSYCNAVPVALFIMSNLCRVTKITVQYTFLILLGILHLFQTSLTKIYFLLYVKLYCNKTIFLVLEVQNAPFTCPYKGIYCHLRCPRLFCLRTQGTNLPVFLMPYLPPLCICLRHARHEESNSTRKLCVENWIETRSTL